DERVGRWGWSARWNDDGALAGCRRGRCPRMTGRASTGGPVMMAMRIFRMDTLLQDIRYGLRILVKTPTFAIVAILTLGLGVGASTAIFSIVNAVLLRSLPFADPDRLVRIYFNNPGVGLRDVRFSVPELEDLRTQTDVFEDVSVIVLGPTNLTGVKQPEHL